MGRFLCFPLLIRIFLSYNEKVYAPHCKFSYFVRHFCSDSDATVHMGKKSYWESFYQTKRSGNHNAESFDWFFSYKMVRDVFESAMTSVSKTEAKGCVVEKGGMHLAELGCGTSTLAQELVEDYPNRCYVTCVDFSVTALEHSRAFTEESSMARNVSRQLEFIAADVCNLPCRGGIFDMVYEKGTMDALLKTESTRHISGKLVREAVRVLKPNGIFLQFSDEPPELRLDLLERVKGDLLGSGGKQLSISFQCLSQDEATEYFVYKIECKPT